MCMTNIISLCQDNRAIFVFLDRWKHYLNEKSSTRSWLESYLGDGIINYENLIFNFSLPDTTVFYNSVQTSSICSNRDSFDNLDKPGIVQ